MGIEFQSNHTPQKPHFLNIRGFIPHKSASFRECLLLPRDLCDIFLKDTCSS